MPRTSPNPKTKAPTPPILCVNPNRYPVVLTLDRNGSMGSLLPGEKIVGERFLSACVDKGLMQVKSPIPEDYIGAKDPTGQGREYLAAVNAQLVGDGATMVPLAGERNGSTFDGMTRAEWLRRISSSEDGGELLSRKPSDLMELSAFLGLKTPNVSPTSSKKDWIDAIIAEVTGAAVA